MEQIEGRLHKNELNRFELNDHEFTSGEGIQVYSEEYKVWLVGRVEYSHKIGQEGYFFYSRYPDLHSFPLSEGMQARVGYERDHVSPWMIRDVLEAIGDSVIEATREKDDYPKVYKAVTNASISKLQDFLTEIETLPFLNL